MYYLCFFLQFHTLIRNRNIGATEKIFVLSIPKPPNELLKLKYKSSLEKLSSTPKIGHFSKNKHQFVSKIKH